jgi:hypothetical protein
MREQILQEYQFAEQEQKFVVVDQITLLLVLYCQMWKFPEKSYWKRGLLYLPQMFQKNQILTQQVVNRFKPI